LYASAEKWNEFYDRMEQKALSLVDPATGRLASPYAENIACPLCGSTSSSPRVEKHGFTYVNCRQCQFVYVNPQLTHQAILEVYNDEDIREFFFKELLLAHVERDQRAEFEGRLRELQLLVRTSSPRLLDIGCAAGLFLSLAEKQGFRAEGLELNQLYVEYVMNNRSVTVHQKTLEEMRYPYGAFNVVTLWDVLEHLPKPLETLREAARVTAPGGVLALTTINHACINERLLRGRWRYYMPPDHLCSFTPDMLESLLSRAGFTVLKIQHHYMFEVLAERSFRFLAPAHSPGGLTVPTNKFRKLSYVILALASQFVFNTLKSGDLLTVYARKSQEP